MQEILQIISDVTKISLKDIDLTVPLEALGVDSLDKLEILMRLESKFGVKLGLSPLRSFSDSPLIRIKSINDLIALVEEKCSSQ